MEPRARRAARLLVVDQDSGEVLLFQYEDAGRRWWATPGGGLEGDETFEQAAIREAGEELALSCQPGAPIWRRTVEFPFKGARIRQEEEFFLVRVARGELALGRELRDAHRDEGIIATRWWTLADIDATSEQVFPEDLAHRLRELRADITQPSP